MGLFEYCHDILYILFIPFVSRRSTPGETTPSRVVHVRGLPAYTTESELLSLCTPFGTVIRVLLLQQQQQAFVQMASVEVRQGGAVVTAWGT